MALRTGRHSERCMFVYDGVTPTLMKFLCGFYGSYSYSGFRSGIAVDPYDTRGTANEIYQVRMLTSKCTTRSSPLSPPKPHRSLPRGSPPAVCVPARSTSLRRIFPWFPSSIWGVYSHSMSIRRNKSCCSTLKVPSGSAQPPRGIRTPAANPRLAQALC